MLNFASKKIGPIGLDIGHDSIRMIQLASSGEKARLIAADETQLNTAVDADELVFRLLPQQCHFDRIKRQITELFENDGGCHFKGCR